MAKVDRGNPLLTTTGVEMMGGDMKFFTVDYIVAMNAAAGPKGSATGAQAAALDAISVTCNVVAVGPLGNSNTEQTFAVEGDATAATIQTAIRALGTTGGADMSGATVTAKDLYIAV